jgi:hypothetical protein
MPPQSKLFRIVAYLVLGAYALTNICVVHATENAFWESRRAAVKERRGTLYASLSTVQNPAALAQFVPKTSPLTSPLASAPSLISSEHPLRWLSPLVTPYGTVREVHLSRTPHAPLVIHIQDVHGYLDAQENMAKMIQNVAEASPLTVVGVEGAEGAFKIDDFRRYPNREIQTNVAHFFLKKDLIGAAEYAALTSTKPLTLWGVEDMTLYRQNVSAVKASLAARTQAQKLVTDIHIVLTDRKKNIYSKELNAYDHFTTTYEKNQIGLGDYVKKLLSLRGTSSVSPQIQIFLTALHEEASLDFKAVERDRLRLIDRLVEILDKPALDGLVQTSLNYRSGQLTHGDYHRALDSILKQHNMEWSSFPTLKRYIAYVGLADTINRDNLLKELRQLEDSTQNFLAQTPEQKELMNLTNDTQLLARLTNNQMSPDDWQSYSARRKETHRLATRLPITPSVNFPSDFPTFLKPFEDFCSLALARNDAFAQTLLAKMKETKSHSAVLVAGGFHTEGLLKNLKTQGASYVVLTPKIEKIDSAKNYLDVFAHDPLPLEKLFTGEPIALLTERALATDSPLAKQMHAADLAAHLSTENKAFQTQGLPATKILDALSVFLTGLQTLVGARLAALKPKIIYVSPKDGVTFTILVQGMIHWMRANTDGSVTSTSSTPQISNRAHRLYVKVGDWLFSLIRNLIPEQKMTTPEGIILSVGEPKPISNVVAIQRLAPEIMLYLNGREKIGAFLNLREYLWATLNGNPKELDLAVKSIKSNITTALWTGKLYNASHLIEILGYLTSDPNSEEFLTKLNGQSTAGLENSRLLLNITSALVWMESNRSLMSQMAKPNSMFYGPFIAVKDKDFKLKGLSNSGQKWIWLGHKSKKVKFETNLALDKEGNVLIVHRKELIPHSPPIASKKQLVNHLRSVSRPEKEGLGVGEDRLIFTQSIINDFVAYRWLQILDLGVMNVELTVEPAGDMTIVRSFSVANGQTKNLHSLRQEFEALLNVASFPTGNEVRMLHIPYNGASGFAFDVNSFYDPRNENTNKGTIPALYNGRFISKWADRINDPMALDRLLVMRMNSVPREVMQAIIEEAYATVYGEINLWRHSTEIKVYLENWDTMRKCLAEKYLIPPFPQDQASSSPPVVHYEGMKLINGGRNASRRARGNARIIKRH